MTAPRDPGEREDGQPAPGQPPARGPEADRPGQPEAQEQVRENTDVPPQSFQPGSAPVPGEPGAMEHARQAIPTPQPAKPSIAQFLGLLSGSLEQFQSALILVAERHEADYEVASISTVLAGWVHEDRLALQPFMDHYGVIHSDQPERIRAGLLGGVRTGLLGLMTDLTDLSLLAEHVEMSWKVAFQGGKELHDEGLLAVSGAGRAHAKRAIRWLRTMLDHTAPEALTAGPDVGKMAKASLPKGPDRVAGIPDPVWGPVASGLMIAIVGAVALLAGRPWLLPSLGPTAALAAELPGHPSSRPWNTLVGHTGGLAAGFIGVVIAGAANQPSVLVDHVLAPPRVLASVIAIALTLLLGGLLKASHPPAAATTLLVSLGAIRTTTDALNLVAGVIVITIVAYLFREVRIRRVTPAERAAPADGLMRRFLRRSPG
jgi:hypothetical protein